MAVAAKMVGAAVEQTRAERNIAWIEEYCKVPDGRDVGQNIRLRPWQQDILKAIYDNPHGTRSAVISMGRKNAKSALAAMLLLLHLIGPEAKQNSQLVSYAMNRDQAALLFALSAKMVRMSPDLDSYIVCRDTRKELFCAELGTLYRALSAEGKSNLGSSPVFSVGDELAGERGETSEIHDSVITGSGAHENPLNILISTQAPSDNAFFSRHLDDALSGKDPQSVGVLYSADESLDPFSDEAILQANPAANDFSSMSLLQRAAKKASRLPSFENTYRNLHLNQRIDLNTPFITRSVWEDCKGEVPPLNSSMEVYAGLDLSEVADLTAFVLVAFDGKKKYVYNYCWLPEEGLEEKSRADRVPWTLWRDQGFLRTTPGKTISYEYVAKQIYDILLPLNVKQVNFDRWQIKHLKPWLSKSGFSEEQLEGDEALFKGFGQGFQSFSPALLGLESDILNKTLVHDGNPVLTSCVASTVIQADAAGNRKPAKNKSSGRIDCLVSLVMANSAAATHDAVERSYSMFVLG